MRRKEKTQVIPQRQRIHAIRPWFFWRKCNICGDELRRETMYEISIDWTTKSLQGNTLGVVVRSNGISIDTYCFCMECCPTIEDARMEFDKRFAKMYEGV